MRHVYKTSFVTMYPRIFTDIPYCQKIYTAFQRYGWPSSLEDKKPFLAPELEYRYKVIENAITSTEYELLVELGAGLSPRGLIYSAQGIDYLEVDLKVITNLKKKLIREVTLPSSSTGTLTVMGGDVLCDETWKAIKKHIGHRKVTFINEGLLRYLPVSKKRFICKNISKLIKGGNGAWITADVTLESLIRFQKESVFKNQTDLSKLITELPITSTFPSLEHAVKFFIGATNLSVEVNKPDSINLSSQTTLGLNNYDIYKLVEHVHVLKIS